MKKILLLLMAIPFIGCSSDKEDDYSNKSQQELWINGYVTTSSAANANSEPAIIHFLFFKEDQVKNFEGENIKTGIDSYYDYTKFEEDPIYTKLIDENKLLLNDGSMITPIFQIDTPSKGKTKEIALPVGRYFVIAYYYERGYRRDYWNKYATTIYNLESRYAPQILSVVIPIDYTQYGKIDWRKWND